MIADEETRKYVTPNKGKELLAIIKKVHKVF